MRLEAYHSEFAGASDTWKRAIFRRQSALALASTILLADLLE
jgi:hypothetical protein